MNKYKVLLKNTAIFTISNFSSKFLVFLMLPIYTRVMTTADFGKADLIITTVSLLMQIFTFCVADGALRFALDKQHDNKQVFTFGLKVIFIGFLMLILSYPILIKIDIIKNYIVFFYLLYITSAISNYFNQFVRGIEKVKLIGIVGIISTIVTVGSNLLFLVIFKFGVNGYIISNILMNIASMIILFYYGRLYKYFYSGIFEKKFKKEMNEYNIPLIPNRINWWAIMISDRYIVNYFCGATAVGIVSVANRIPTIIITIYGVIQQALLISVISEYDKNDNEVFFGRIYNFMNIVLLFAVSFLILIVKPLSSLLFGSKFYVAWQLVPLLSVAILFGALHGFLTTIFSAVKQTKILLYNSIIGAVISIIFNFILIPILGIIGSSFASLLTYFIVWVMLLYSSRKYVKFPINLLSDFTCYFIILFQAIFVSYINSRIVYLVSVISIVLIFVVKYKQLSQMAYLFKNAIFKKIHGRKN